jgi:hypothetical protein
MSNAGWWRLSVLRESVRFSPLTPALSPKGARGKGADLHVLPGQSSTRYFKSVQLAHTARSVPSPPRGEGEREPIFVLFKPEFDSVFQVGATCTYSAVSSLYLWERVRVRAVGNFKF